MKIQGEYLLNIYGIVFLFNHDQVVGYFKKYNIYTLRKFHLEFLKSKNVEINPDVIANINKCPKRKLK